MNPRSVVLAFGIAAASLAVPAAGHAQTPPSAAEMRAYEGLHAAVAAGDLARMARLILAGADVNATDTHGRTPLMVAAYGRDRDAVRALVRGGGNLNALDSQSYDVLTIAAVLDDPGMIELAASLGADATLITSPYEGTALIAAAHLGHVEVVRALIAAEAPLDHVNNLGWTALIEAIVLGDGGPRHVATLRALVEAGAEVNLADGKGVSPLALARRRGYTEMIRILEAAGAKP
ncbi:MAG: ankyrin repeat domain-containing protein [Magnetovibrio sp.]|nr:ankyrin repeat domain-containing protein [Magnetovibrio sp.]